MCNSNENETFREGESDFKESLRKLLVPRELEASVFTSREKGEDIINRDGGRKVWEVENEGKKQNLLTGK